MTSNQNLHSAKNSKDDEFYTTLVTIEKELPFYQEHFKDMVIYLPCDDLTSMFFKYFFDNFHRLGLKSLYATHINSSEILTYDGVTLSNLPMEEPGDFRSPSCLRLFETSDIICTNPPFSLYREFLNTIYSFGKKFLILGPQNVLTYKETIQRIVTGNLWTGVNHGDMSFTVPPDSPPRATRYWEDSLGKWRSFGNMCWFTNLEHNKRHDFLELNSSYDSQKYPVYDSYSAINVNKVSEIPKNFYGIMGVPITFIFKWNPEQFEVLGTSRYHDGNFDKADDIAVLNGKELFMRFLIKRKQFL